MKEILLSKSEAADILSNMDAICTNCPISRDRCSEIDNACLLDMAFQLAVDELKKR